MYKTSQEMYMDDLSSPLDFSSSFSYSSTLPENSIYEELDMQTSASSTPIIPSSLFNSSIDSNDQISNIIQRATELQFVVQKLIVTHVPEKNHSLLIPSLNETMEDVKDFSNSQAKSNNMTDESDNENVNQKQLLLLLRPKQDKPDLIPSPYDYDSIKDISDKLLFYNDICAIPPYFREIYDTAYQDGMLNVGIDAEDFFILN
ncbi:hypothetical protein C1645_800681 [Glomus cerebriforme]|uniref:Uncharacterized protein n=1 Tax=Glomus cerebriforme TaxID=658196 RepID=A0A397TM42_9GLOM|nr:hypothetical protein C1645_800681 [Glomus cerebriforme]